MALPTGNYKLDNQSMASATAQGGRISNGMVVNSSGSGIGLVKMLTLAGIGVILWRLWGK